MFVDVVQWPLNTVQPMDCQASLLLNSFAQSPLLIIMDPKYSQFVTFSILTFLILLFVWYLVLPAYLLGIQVPIVFFTLFRHC